MLACNSASRKEPALIEKEFLVRRNNCTPSFCWKHHTTNFALSPLAPHFIVACPSTCASLRASATVDGNVGPRHETGIVAGQPHCCRGDIFRLTKSPHGHSATEALPCLWSVLPKEGRHHARFSNYRTDAINAHATRSKFCSETLGCIDDRTF